MNVSTKRIVRVLALALPLAWTGVADADSTASGGEEPTASAWQVGLHIGSIVPRADLQVGVLAGLDFSMQIGPDRLRLAAGFDWSRLGQHDSTLVGPTNYPRARVDLLQTSDLYTAYAGANYELAKLGGGHVYAGALLGITANRSEFETVNMSVPENDVSAMVGAVLGATGPAGPVAWRVEVGWREIANDLGDSGDFGESTMSGLLVSAGVGLAR